MAGTGRPEPASGRWASTDAESPFPRRDSAGAESPAGTAVPVPGPQEKPLVVRIHYKEQQADIAAAAGIGELQLLAGCTQGETEAVEQKLMEKINFLSKVQDE